MRNAELTKLRYYANFTNEENSLGSEKTFLRSLAGMCKPGFTFRPIQF